MAHCLTWSDTWLKRDGRWQIIGAQDAQFPCKWLAWQDAFGDIYVTNPPFAKKKTDLLLTTGLNVTFTH